MSGEWSFKYTSAIVGVWPKDQDGQPEEPVFLKRVFGNETVITMTRNMLWACGVPSVGRYPSDGVLGRVILGESGCGMDIFVPRTMLEDARAIIEPESGADEDGDNFNDDKS